MRTTPLSAPVVDVLNAWRKGAFRSTAQHEVYVALKQARETDPDRQNHPPASTSLQLGPVNSKFFTSADAVH